MLANVIGKLGGAKAVPNLIKVASVASGVTRGKHTLPDLPYDYNALEPTISAEIMQLHHGKHHNTYVTNLNQVEEKFAEAQSKNDVKAMITLSPALKFNGGGHINHSIFWQNMCPGGSEAPKELLDQVIKDFGSFDKMKATLTATTVGIQGSGWGWLGFNKQMGRLQIVACPNQDPLEATTGLVPLFGIDVWEHAYYLQYKNVRPDYVNKIYDVANWKDVAERLVKAKQ